MRAGFSNSLRKTKGIIMSEEKPKIIVDDDWKAQAQAEKEKLQKEVEEKQAQQQRQLPPANFLTLMNTQAMQAMQALGGFEDPSTGKRFVDLEIAKLHIDLMNVLKEKTAGNLDEEEQKLFERTLQELQLAYVHIAENAKQMSPEEVAEMQKQTQQGEQ